MRGAVTTGLMAAVVALGGCISVSEGTPPPLPAVPGVSRTSPEGIHLYVANLDGSGIRRLTRGESGEPRPSGTERRGRSRCDTRRPLRDAAPGVESEGAIEVFAPGGSHIRRIATPVERRPAGVVAGFASDRVRLEHRDRGAMAVRDQLNRGPLGNGEVRALSERAAAEHAGRARLVARRPPDRLLTNVAPARGDLRELSVIGADGSGERRLTHDLDEESEPHWLDDDRLLFQQLVPPQPGDSRPLSVIDADGGKPRVAVEGLYYSYPAVSPDGRRVAVAGTLDVPGAPRLNLHVARLGGKPQKIAPDLVLDRPTWSPDGKQIAFASGSRVIAVRRDGSGRRVLVELAGRMIREVAWSPDGRRIAFTTGTPVTPSPTRPTPRPIQPTPPGHE